MSAYPPDVSVYYEMPIFELEELVYALQIEYNPPLTENDRDRVIGEIKKIKDNVQLITDESVRKKWKDKRIAEGRNCHEKNTYIAQRM